MMKRIILSTVFALSTAMTLAYVSNVRADDDDVFVDEGDGDFGDAPAAPADAKAAAPAPAAPALQDETPSTSAMDDAFEEPTAPPPPAPAPKAAKASKPKVAKSAPAAGGKGKFVTTKEACKAVREPASTETFFTTQPARKIWVEVVDDQWVRAFNKNAEPGYISTDCVE